MCFCMKNFSELNFFYNTRMQENTDIVFAVPLFF